MSLRLPRAWRASLTARGFRALAGAIAALFLLRAGDNDEFGFVGADGVEVVVFAHSADAGSLGGEFGEAARRASVMRCLMVFIGQEIGDRRRETGADETTGLLRDFLQRGTQGFQI